MSAVFDWINSITYSKKNLLDENGSMDGYNPYITNKSLSYHLDCILFANEMNRRPHLDNDAQYMFLLNSIRKRKRFSPWEKKTTVDKLEIIKKYHNFSDDKANQVVDLFSDEQIQYMKSTLSVIK
jgi:hypothetical protein